MANKYGVEEDKKSLVCIKKMHSWNKMGKKEIKVATD